MTQETRIVLALAGEAEREALARHLAASGLAAAPARVAVGGGGGGPGEIPEALSVAQALVLDAGFADGDAAGLIRALRRQGFGQPVVVLHDGDEAAVVTCLEAGANDAVPRPVRPLELAARLRAQMRQAAARPAEIGPYIFDPGRRLLHEPATGRVIRLTATETAMLRHLHRAGGAIVPRRELLVEVWGYQAGATTHTVETNVYRLRRKIEPVSRRPWLLLSEDGGYRLNLQPRRPEGLAAE